MPFSFLGLIGQPRKIVVKIGEKPSPDIGKGWLILSGWYAHNNAVETIVQVKSKVDDSVNFLLTRISGSVNSGTLPFGVFSWTPSVANGNLFIANTPFQFVTSEDYIDVTLTVTFSVFEFLAVSTEAEIREVQKVHIVNQPVLVKGVGK